MWPWALPGVIPREKKQDILNDLLPTNERTNFGQRQAAVPPVSADSNPSAWFVGAGARRLPAVQLLKFELNSLDPENGFSTCTVVEALVQYTTHMHPHPHIQVYLWIERMGSARALWLWPWYNTRILVYDVEDACVS